MKKVFSLFVFSFMLSMCMFAQFPIGERVVTFVDYARGGRSIETRMFYPATASGTNQPPAQGEFPLLVYGHGFMMGYDAYMNFVNELVPRGYILALPTTEGGMSPSHAEFGADLRFLADKIRQDAKTNTAFFLYNRVADAVALMGHSMGGGSSILGAANNMNINAVINFAAAETNPSAIAAAANVTVPVLMFIGSHDGVTPPAQHQIPIYNNLASKCKTLISITGGGHCYFAEYNWACAFGESTTSPQPTITRAEQHAIMFAFLNPYLDFILKGDQSQRQVFQNLLTQHTGITYQQSCSGTDVALTSILEPNSTCGLTDNEQISVRLMNLGGNSVSSLQVQYQVNNGQPVVETINQPLHTGQSLVYTFSQTENMFAPGTYNITASVNIQDDVTANNSRSIQLQNNAMLLPQAVDFTGFDGSNLHAIFQGWQEAQGTAPSGTTSMWNARTGVGGTTNVTARINMYGSPIREWIISPSFVATQYTMLTFDAAITQYNSTNPYTSVLPSTDSWIVRVSTDCKQTWQDVFVINNSNRPTNQLTSYTVNLGQFAGKVIHVAFFASRTGSTSADYDFHLDNILIKNYPPIDISVVHLLAPAQDECLTTTQQFTVKVMNTGLNPINLSSNPLTVQCFVSGPSGQHQTQTTVSSGIINPDDTMQVNVPSNINMTLQGTYTIQVNITMPGDGDINNNTLLTERSSFAPMIEITGPSFICDQQNAQLSTVVTNPGKGPITTFANNTTMNIPDNNTQGINSTIQINNASTVQASEIISITVNIQHTYVGDLVLQLRAPDNSSIMLCNRRGGSGDNFTNTVFAMNGLMPISQVTNAHAPFTGTFIPEQSFTDLTGSANGTWTLNVSDRQSSDVGQLLSWSITLRVDNQIITYSWSTNENTPQITVSPAQTTTYGLTVTDLNGCQTTASYQLMVFNQSTFSLGNDTTICQGQSVTFNVGTGHTSVVWHDNSTGPSYTASTTETVSVTVENQCGTFTDVVQVTVMPNPVVNLGADTTVCTGDIINLNAGAGYQQYIWSTNETTPSIQVTSQMPATQVYSVTVTDQYGCIGSDQIQIVFQVCTNYIDEAYAGEIMIYPNPTDGLLYVKYDEFIGNIQMVIFSLDGKVILHTLLNHHSTVDLSLLKSGSYQVVLLSEQKVLYKGTLIKY